MEIKDALKKRRLELGLTLLDVANKIGVSEATVSRWESGNIANMRRDKIAMLAKTLKISPAIIMGWEEEDELSGIEGISSISKKRLPLLGNIACGEPIYASEDRESYVEVGSDIQADFCLRAKGDSMIGARIMDGDIVFIRKQDMVSNGEIAAVLIEDEATLKRVQYNRESNELLLFAENPKYKTLRYFGDELNQIRILGKAIAFQGDVI